MQRFLARTLIRPATAGSSGALGVGSAGLPAPTPALCLASRTFQAYKSCGFGHIAALNADIWGRLARPMSSPAPILSPTLGPVGRFRTARFNFSTASKSSDSSKNQKSSSGGKYSLLGVFGLLSVPLYFYFTEHPDAKAVTVAFVRMYRAAKAVVAIAVDYKYSLRNGPEAIGEEAYEAAKSGCHARSAQRLYEMARDNGGVYIKLGQHIAAMSYVLPKEYTDAMRPLQDRCPTTSLADLDAMLKLDLGQSLNDLFAEFDPEPLGIASLAQVHRGVLRSGPHAGREVAIKLQHPYLEQFAQIDISTVSFLVVAIKTIFPSFSFDWLAAQMRENLPKELDFRVEASNARHLAHLFSDDPILKVPEIYDAHKRVMIMEFIHGARLDDRDFLAKHGIDPLRISHHFSEIFSRMIFKEGFVHADPHPGNVLIRPHPGRRDNFDLILLDHGLYRTLDAPFRRCYADLWAALIRGSEPEIERASARLFAMAREEELARRLAQGLHVTLADIEREQGEGNIPSYKLFASVITGRPWSVVVLDGGEGLGVDEAGAYLRDRTAKPVPKKGPPKSGLARARSSSEKNTIASVAGTGEFLLDVADILAKVPSEVVLLLKTNDLLRAMDEELGIGKVPDPSETPEESAKHLAERMQDHMVRMVTRMGWWVARTVYEGRKADFVEQERTRMPEGGNLAWRVFWRKWVSKEMLWARWEFWSVTVRLWVAEIYVGVKLALGM